MVKLGFTKHTYEVAVLNDGRWNLDSVCERKSEAMSRVEEVQNLPETQGVRVTAIDESKGQEEVIHEDLRGLADAMKPVAVDSLPLCQAPDDIYLFASRQAIGRIIRQYLDDQGVSALELMFDPSKLNMLERMDSFYASAMGMAATVQAKASGTKQVDCSDALYKAFGRVRDFAKENKKALDEDAETLRTGGIDFLVGKRKTLPERLGAISCYLSAAGDWSEKLNLLLKLGDGVGEGDGDGQALIDSAIAEILDGAEAIKDLLAGQRDTGTALQGLAQIVRGHFKPPRTAGSALIGLTALLRGEGWHLTRAVLLDRVARGLGGTRALTREGGDKDRDLFIQLVREVAIVDGLAGGPDMAEAVIMRAKIALGKGDENVPTEMALEQVLYMLPSRAARMGLLLDCCRSPLWERYNKPIMAQLAHLIGQVKSIRALVPDGTSPDESQYTIDALKGRLDADDLPAALRESLGAAFGGLLKAGDDRAEPPRTLETNGSKVMPTETDRTEFSEGDVIFTEGDTGSAAYIIAEGEVEICRGNRVLATVGKGEIIGELALIDNQPRMATAKAVGDVQMIRISQDNLKGRIEKLDRSDKVMRLIMETLVRRLRGGARVSE